jgi:hypothetical protein
MKTKTKTSGKISKSKKKTKSMSHWVVMGNAAVLVEQLAVSCCAFYTVGGGLGVYNSCSQCKIAVVSYPGGPLRRYRVPGHSGVQIPVSGGQMSIVDELPC